MDSVNSRGNGNSFPGINVVGYLRAELGLGQGARQTVRAAQAAGVGCCLTEFMAGCVSRADDQSLAAAISNRALHPISLFCVNGDQMPLLQMHLGDQPDRHGYRIGYWAWELPELPDHWSFSTLDEVWVPSRFVLDAVSPKATVPVVQIPYAVGFHVSTEARRADFGLPPDKFLFLVVYDMCSNQSRKNPEAAIAAFGKAFANASDVCLVIKLMNGHTSKQQFRRLEESARGVPGVIILDQVFSRKDMYDLFSVCDCLVSLHRAEGFGLSLAEGMFLGKPVIATGWSGNADFMNHDNAFLVEYQLVKLEKDFGPYPKGGTWAEPDVDHAAWHMARVVENGAIRRRVGAAARSSIRRDLSYHAVGRRIRKRLEVLQQAC